MGEAQARHRLKSREPTVELSHETGLMPLAESVVAFNSRLTSW